MRVARTLAAAISGVLAAGLLGAPAHAVQPPAVLPDPVPSVTLPAELDRAAFYEAQTLCDPVPRAGANALADLLRSTYGPAVVYIPRGCTSSTSEHFDGRAVDWMRSVRVPAEKAQADAFVNWLLAPDANGTPHAMARRLGMMYIIWNNRMIRMYDVGRGWTNYRNCQSSANSGSRLDTSCHRNHVHFSMSWDGAGAVTSWWSGVAQTQPFCSSRYTSAKKGAGSITVVPSAAHVSNLVRVSKRRILETRSGIGAGLNSPCRVLAGRSLYPSAIVSGVPAGATHAVLKVKSWSNAPARLSVWSSGGTRPRGQVSTPIGATTSIVVVPLASDGSIGLSTSLGAANLKAWVLGYTTGTASVSAPNPVEDAPVVVEPAPEVIVAPVISRPTSPVNVTARTLKYRKGVKTMWEAPKGDGGSPVTGYVVEALRSKKKGASVAGSCTVGPAKRACKIKKLRKRKYWMSVSVSNEAGRTWAQRVKVRVLAPQTRG